MLLLLVVIIGVLAFLMEVGAIALKMTGLDINDARFQALSALTGTGFTTIQAEKVVEHYQRRRIIMALMVIGSAGLVSILITIVSAVRAQISLFQLAGALFGLVVLIRVITNRWLIKTIDRHIENTLEKRTLLQRQPIEEVLKLDSSHGVAEVIISEESPLGGKNMFETDFREHDIMVLAIERGDEVIHGPKSKDVLAAGDRLIVYGNLENLKMIDSSLIRQGEA
ncbi:MAG: TrkA C-terminal domain-containing protein [Halanaerobium sp.]|nr:TrkA C-terminal domain-containing protein [Halanaerobium sp.]